MTNSTVDMKCPGKCEVCGAEFTVVTTHNGVEPGLTIPRIAHEYLVRGCYCSNVRGVLSKEEC